MGDLIRLGYWRFDYIRSYDRCRLVFFTTAPKNTELTESIHFKAWFLIFKTYILLLLTKIVPCLSGVM